MPDGPHESPYGQPLRVPPGQTVQPMKMLPVLFVLATISMLYLIYVLCHCLPMLQLAIPPNQVDEGMALRGGIECIVFHIITFMVMACYVRCVLVYPGQVPDHEWSYRPDAPNKVPPRPALLKKQSGEYRNCRWCFKFKPDRCHHCSVCGICVLKMDHHCPWIYNCVGYHNYKFFFLLLFYVALAVHMIIWTMSESMARAIEEDAAFLLQFFLLFGLSLSFFLGTIITLFFAFHVWLMFKGMTTIEFCEQKGGGEDATFMSPFNLGAFGNLQSVLGQNPLLWLLPIGVEGDGLSYQADPGHPLLANLEVDRGSRKRSRKLLPPPVQSYGSLAQGQNIVEQQRSSYSVDAHAQHYSTSSTVLLLPPAENIIEWSHRSSKYSDAQPAPPNSDVEEGNGKKFARFPPSRKFLHIPPLQLPLTQNLTKAYGDGGTDPFAVPARQKKICTNSPC